MLYQQLYPAPIMPRGKLSIHPDVKKRLLEQIKERGAKVRDVAEEHGLSPKTMWGWMAKGSRRRPFHPGICKVEARKHRIERTHRSNHAGTLP